VRPQVVVACAEGELHILPARMVADRLRLAGCRTVFLGAVSSGQLRSVVHEWCPDAIVLSCTMAFNFAGLVRSLSAVSDADAPVFIGGAAVSDAALAERLGADGWAEDATDLVRAVMGARTPARRSGRRLWPEEPFILQERLPALTGIALTAILERSQRLEPYDGWSLALTGELVEHLLTTAAVLVDDPSVLVAFAQWSAAYLRHRGEHPLVLAASMVEVAARCDAELAGIGRFLHLAAEQVAASDAPTGGLSTRVDQVSARPGSMTPSRIAIATASSLECAPNFVRMLRTCVRIVLGLMKRRLETSAVDLPVAIC